ncbi:hypothetical protein A3C18_03395 [Candidatus Kaiserbacteria bacterium RIFCSPHIGHO2_02_FULL_54_11b]|uniref:Uncharacterized protein n=2 Tax=Candidatus Kaiseribacteriota TaxID=1752734 RepID=A0A1F6CK15_9BACT|nr:MAG: hypothetical protein A2704_04240 [Candidatus Kaiserbacteria bacterium RIFCSPHIGHO2_01_FULL_54_36b]OGG64613.1 MAG: hypothetical protein A3C18_03395 [Candidatus Kaiserbacteria bacterium RIFCSPHIGHO2_02_FULL_54_11b]
MTRRTFLRGAAATAAVGIAGATGLAGMTAIGQLKMEQLARFLDDASGEPQYDYDTAISEAKTFLKTAYDIDLKVGVGKDHENIVGDHASMERTRDTLRHLVQELKRYPPDMIQKLGEGRGFQIHIVESRLIVKDKAPTGEIVMERSVAGVAPFLKEGRPATMILKSDGEDEWQRTLIHHELNHRFAEKWQVWRERDEKWIAMHAPMTERPYWGYYKVNDRKDKTPTPAYVFRRYGLAAPVEDQAICAEAALIPRLHAYMEDAIRTTADPHAKKVLRAKLQATKADYLVWSGGKMDAKYWERLCKEHKDDYVADVSPDEYTDASFGDEWREHVPLPRPRPRIGKSRRK